MPSDRDVRGTAERMRRLANDMETLAESYGPARDYRQHRQFKLWAAKLRDDANEIEAALLAAEADGMERAAKVAEYYIINKGELHPDVPFDKLSENAKHIAHLTCQYVAAAIRALTQTRG